MIVILDDHKALALALQRLLERAGQEAVSFTNATDALASLHHRHPELLVLDVNMPDVDGLTFLRRMKADADLRFIPVVMFSADNHDEVAEEALRLGAVDFLPKSGLDLDTLLARLCHLAKAKPLPN
jgi:two-component system, chemotaxis family, chemotaxis protein CheY